MGKLKSIRKRKMLAQHGRCYYCDLPMWDGAATSALNRGRTSLVLRCTAEHLHARSEGGRDTDENIVAACWFCNTRRHLCKKPRNPQAHRKHVQQRLAEGKWLTPLMNEAPSRI